MDASVLEPLERGLGGRGPDPAAAGQERRVGGIRAREMLRQHAYRRALDGGSPNELPGGRQIKGVAEVQVPDGGRVTRRFRLQCQPGLRRTLPQFRCLPGEAEADVPPSFGQAEREIGHVPPQAARRLDCGGEDEAAHRRALTDLRMKSWMEPALSRISGGHPPVRLRSDA